MYIDPKNTYREASFKFSLDQISRHTRYSGDALITLSSMLTVLQEYFPHYEYHYFSDFESHDRPYEIKNIIQGDIGVREYIVDDDLKVIHLFLNAVVPKVMKESGKTYSELDRHNKNWADLQGLYPDHKFRVLYMYTGRELYDPIITGTFDRFSYNVSEVMKTVYVFLDEDILSKNEAFLGGTWDDLAELKR